MNEFHHFVTSVIAGHVQSKCPTKEVWLPKDAAPSEAEKAKNLETIHEYLILPLLAWEP